MNEIIERAAKAIYESPLLQPARAGEPWDGPSTATKTFCRLAARDVLKAIRDPTEAMVEAAEAINHPSAYDAKPDDEWRAMVDAALGGDKTLSTI